MTRRKTTIERTTRTDQIVTLRTTYRGTLDTPTKYNKAFAEVLRTMADAIEAVDDAWVDPEVVVWMHEPGVITAEDPFSEQA